ncbi:hypothetical protein OIU78_016366 [Salix suchowensis]|nr:hypothetical protein OIU78_016366 [Salix suchowensis]
MVISTVLLGLNRVFFWEAVVQSLCSSLQAAVVLMRSLSVLLPSLPSSSVFFLSFYHMSEAGLAVDDQGDLQLKPLVDLTSCALSRTIEGKTPAAFLRETFLFNLNVDVEEEHADDCSVEDLLSYINGEDGGFSAVTFSPKLGFDEADIDDNLDPAMTEELDRLIAMFDCLHSLNEFNLYLVLSGISCGILMLLKQ